MPEIGDKRGPAGIWPTGLPGNGSRSAGRRGASGLHVPAAERKQVFQTDRHNDPRVGGVGSLARGDEEVARVYHP